MQDTEITITVKAKDVEKIREYYDLTDKVVTDRQLRQHVTLFFRLRGLRGIHRIEKGGGSDI